MTAISRRTALTAVPFAVATIAYVGTFLTHYDRLPERIATHFSFDGSPDGFMGRASALWLGGALLVGLGLLFTVLTAASGKRAGTRLNAAIGAGTAAALGYPLVVTVLVNSDAQGAAEAQMPVRHVAALLFGGLLTGALAWWLSGAEPRPAPAPAAPSLALADGEAAAWSRTEVSRVLLLTAAAVTIAGVSTAAFGAWRSGLPLLVIGLVCLAFTGVRVTVDRRGLTIASTLLPRPRLALPLGSIAKHAAVSRSTPWENSAAGATGSARTVGVYCSGRERPSRYARRADANTWSPSTTRPPRPDCSTAWLTATQGSATRHAVPGPSRFARAAGRADRRLCTGRDRRRYRGPG